MHRTSRALCDWSFHGDDCEEDNLSCSDVRLYGIYLSTVRRNVLFPSSWLTSDYLGDRTARVLRVETFSSTHTSRSNLATVFFLISVDVSLPDRVEVQVQPAELINVLWKPLFTSTLIIIDREFDTTFVTPGRINAALYIPLHQNANPSNLVQRKGKICPKLQNL